MVTHICKVAHLSKQVVCALVPSSNTRLHFSFWFMPTIAGSERKIGELSDFQGDKIDPFVYKAIKKGRDSELYVQYLNVKKM